jgi:hypothetical protein
MWFCLFGTFTEKENNHDKAHPAGARCGHQQRLIAHHGSGYGTHRDPRLA